MANKFNVNVQLGLTPVYHDQLPEVIVRAGDQQVQVLLDQPRVFEFEYTASDQSFVEVEFLNKTDSETVPAMGLDKAIKIDFVSFFGIRDLRFVWAGQYTPVYPEPWFSEQQPRPNCTVKNTTYLGWNGVWRLDFDVPVFTWIHQTQAHGWLYNA
jgi:hypothetical protein